MQECVIRSQRVFVMIGTTRVSLVTRNFKQALVFQIDEDMATRNAICGALMALYVDGRPRINTAGRGFACAAARTTCHPTQTATTSDPSSMVPRRALFAARPDPVHAGNILGPRSAAVACGHAQPRASINVDPSNFDFPVIELPKDFVQLAYDLIDALRDAIEADLSGAPEREVRRKADPAKDLVKRFINSWSGSSAHRRYDGLQRDPRRRAGAR